MPTYGYRCGTCGHEFEVLQKITAEPLTKCPKCGGVLSKKVYAAGVIFTGSGYYTTDYKGKSGDASSSNGVAPSADKSSDAKPASDAKSESSSESRSASKSEPKSESKSESKPTSKADSKTEKAS